MRAFLLLLVLSVPSLALAQDPPLAAHAHVMPVQVITARPQRPSAFYLLTRARVRFDRPDGAHHAVDQIVESVAHAPF